MSPAMPLTLIIFGALLAAANRPWSRFLAARRRLGPRQAGALRANLLYNAAVAMLAGVLLLAHQRGAASILVAIAWALFMSVPLLTLALAPFTAGWSPGAGGSRMSDGRMESRRQRRQGAKRDTLRDRVE